MSHALSRRMRSKVLEDRTAKRCGFASSLLDFTESVDVVQRDGISGVATRLGKGTVGKGMLMRQVANWMGQTKNGKCGQFLGSSKRRRLVPGGALLEKTKLATFRMSRSCKQLIEYQPAIQPIRLCTHHQVGRRPHRFRRSGVRGARRSVV